MLRTAVNGGFPRPATTTITARHYVIVAETHVLSEMDQSEDDWVLVPPSDAVRMAWADLANGVAQDLERLQGTTLGERRAWLLCLGIVVRVWPRGSGRGVKIMTWIAPADDRLFG